MGQTKATDQSREERDRQACELRIAGVWICCSISEGDERAIPIDSFKASVEKPKTQTEDRCVLQKGSISCQKYGRAG